MQQLSRTLGVVGAIYVVLAAAMLWLSAPYAVSGLVLGRSLEIRTGSQVPAQSVRPGDKVVAVDGRTVTSARELAAVLATSDGPEVDVTIEERGRVRTATMSKLRFQNAPPPDLLSAARIVRVGGTAIEGPMPVSELEAFLDRADPSPIEVEYEPARARIGGPLAVRRRPHSPLVLAWLGLGAVGLIGVGTLASQRLSVRPPVMGIAAVAAGALALSGLTAAVVADGTSPAFAPWALALATLWGAIAAAARRDGEDSPGILLFAPAVAVVVGAAWVTFGSVGVDAVGGWIRAADHFAIAGSAVALAYVGAGAAAYWDRGRWKAHMTLAGLAVGIGFAAWLAGARVITPGEAAVWTALIAGAVAWPIDVAAFGRASTAHRWRGPVGDGAGLSEVLASLVDEVPSGCRAHVVAGVDESFVDIVLQDEGIGARLAATPASESLSGLLAMLALEGGMFPRHATVRGNDVLEDDPFANVGDRIGLVVAVPIGAFRERAGVSVFAVVTCEDDGASGTLGIPAFVEAVADLESATLLAESVALASDTLLQALRRAERRSRSVEAVPASSEAGPSTAAPRSVGSTQPPVEAREGTAATPLDARWSTHLAEELQRSYPVDDTEVLNDREWVALSFLRESIRPALIVGEPGVGKEFVARAVHSAMWGDSRRFAVVDCSERPASIVRIELFGDEEMPGLVEAVGTGTLLLKGASALEGAQLDEVVGRLVRARARTVFAERYTGDETGVPRNVPDAIRAAVEDRNIHLSPLRDRPGDIVRYARFFLHRAAMRYDVMVTGLSPDAEEWLRGRHFAGNLHELAAVVTAGVLRARGEQVDRVALGASEPVASASREGGEESRTDQATLSAGERSERDSILEALEANDGNRTKAAESLDMTRGSLLRRLRKYGID